MKSSFSVGIAQFCLTKGEEKKVYIFFQTIIGFNYSVCVCVCVWKNLVFLVWINWALSSEVLILFLNKECNKNKQNIIIKI